MRISADRDRCEGHGMCEALLPNVFRVDETGTVRVLVDEVAETDLADVRLAVDSCPVEALGLAPD
ncbi:ferredoxin [Nocardia sp. NBC_00565]|uniref:ferredoxin n=1 Tax=Nocardia sp. NBC_00565 TaxID=2975993 RepID=UPI002E81ACFF|nr:ferredoxin [Nocardia sp. NBC_00565]WUC06186.1 ferredoxin [Nocardia sp. NBC_00565]